MKENPIRSEIFDTGHPGIKAARIEIAASPSTIFAILSNPKRHKEFDGSSTITSNISGPAKLELGSKFGMQMRLGINYRITNRVVEFRENELIAWRHLGRWVWRYELKAIGPNLTLVTETFDSSKIPGLSRYWLNVRKAYPWVQMAVAKSLVRLKTVSEEN
jgi:uncharacterized protein YndB with AHSA1/START domain